MDINLKIEKKRIKVGDLRRAFNNDIDATIRLIAACMVEPDGKFMEREKAVGILDELDLEVIEEDIAPRLLAAMEVAKENALPLAKGTH